MHDRPEKLSNEGNDYEQHSDAKALERLREIGVENAVFAFTIEDEKDLEGTPIDAEIFWIRFKKPEGKAFADCVDVEGKLYLPKGESTNHELILFTPGFPGGNAGRFEQRYAKEFSGAGYAFFTVRHNGTNLVKPDTAPEVLNSRKRMDLAAIAHEQHIGGTRPEGYGMSDIAREPITPLLALQHRFRRIHMMGQSMGVAASYNAVTRMEARPDVLKKIGNVVGIAGYVGKEDGGNEEAWDGMKKPVNELIDYEFGYIQKVGTNAIPDKERFRQDMKDVAAVNARMQVPEHVGNILVFTPGDPLIAGPDTTKDHYSREYGPRTDRKLIIRDETDLKDPKQHSMLWISPANLLRAVQANVSARGPHYIKVPRSAESGMIEKG